MRSFVGAFVRVDPCAYFGYLIVACWVPRLSVAAGANVALLFWLVN
jgi:hypothetical protein